MVRVEIIAVGKEILSGRIRESNANWMAGALTSHGFRVEKITVLDDDMEVIAAQILSAKKRATEILILCGGLGPTFDDVTMAGVAKGLGLELGINRKALEFVRQKYQEYFDKEHVSFADLTPEREKMALLPKDAQWIPNPVGAAPGAILIMDKLNIFVLPGPPKELMPMFNNFVLPAIITRNKNERFQEISMETDCKDESFLTKFCKDAVDKFPGLHAKTNPTFFGDSTGLTITLSVGAKTGLECKKTMDKVKKWLKKTLGDNGIRLVD